MISVAAGALALFLSCFMDNQLPAAHPVATPQMNLVVRSRTSHWALVFFLSGFLAIALQVVWFRIAIVTTLNSPLVFSIILACFLLFDGLGSLAGIRSLAVGFALAVVSLATGAYRRLGCVCRVVVGAAFSGITVDMVIFLPAGDDCAGCFSDRRNIPRGATCRA